MKHAYLPFNPSYRLLMGPGPINLDPRVQRAMSLPILGQYDPEFTQMMTQTQAIYREVFQTHNPQTLLVDGTSRAGIESLLGSAIEAGDKVLVPSFGRFGLLLGEILNRLGAKVKMLEVPWGEVFAPEQIEQAIVEFRPKLLAVVDGDTSTSLRQPLEPLGEICRLHGVLLYTDATATLGGNELFLDAWHIDAISSGLQKCLAGPPGIAPVSMNEAFSAEIRKRHYVEAGIADTLKSEGTASRLNHHTESASMLYAAYESARILLAEGLEATIQRHRIAGHAMAQGLAEMGLQLFGNQDYKMNNVVGVYIPAEVDGEAIRSQMLDDFAIEIGTSFGPLRGKIWRLGTMGYNARQDAVLHTLMALQTLLISHKAKISHNPAALTALSIYKQTSQ